MANSPKNNSKRKADISRIPSVEDSPAPKGNAAGTKATPTPRSANGQAKAMPTAVRRNRGKTVADSHRRANYVPPRTAATREGTGGAGYGQQPPRSTGGDPRQTTGRQEIIHVKRKGNGKRLLRMAGFVAAAVLVVYFGIAYYFSSHFGLHTTINSISCTGLTVEQAEAAVMEQANDYTLKVVERENGEEAINGSDIGLGYASDGTIDRLLQEQSAVGWITRLFSAPEGEQKATLKFSEEKLKTAIDSLSCMNPNNMVKPADAYPEWDGSQYVAHEEVMGTTLDTDKTYSVINDAVSATADSIDLEANDCYINPEVTTESKKLIKEIELYNKYTPYTLTYTFPDESTQTLEGSTMIKWYTFDDDGKATLDEDKIASWAKEFAQKYDTYGDKRKFDSPGTGKTETVSGGTYGWQIDEAGEVEAIAKMLNEGKESAVTREPVYAARAAVWPTDGAADFGTTYAEVDLSSQHMWYIKDNQVAFESDIVSGLPTEERETPPGVYEILDKQSPYTMHGEADATGAPSYVTECKYWMRVTWTGIGFHDASWQSAFGGSRYKSYGSHGCLNMPPSGAKELYSLISEGTPVVIHS